MIKVLERVGLKGTYFNTIKAIYKKPTANSIYMEKKIEATSLKSKMRQGCVHYPYSFSISDTKY